ncbi:MAG: hypothetical protein WA777_06590 [Rhodanobacter sp.]
MMFSRMVMAAATIVGCLGMASCAEDSPKTVLQDREAYLSRTFTLSALPSSVQDKLAQSTGNPPSFSRLTLKRKTTIKYVSNGATVETTADVIYQNAGNGLIRELIIQYVNGIEVESYYSLKYRDVFPLLSQEMKPSDARMPYLFRAKSVVSMDTSFDQPSLSYVYTLTSNDPRGRTVNRGVACDLTKTYPATKINSNIQGTAREFTCNFLNENGVIDFETDYVYLQSYGLAIAMGQHSNKMEMTRDIVDFKAE